eukprot:Skav215735  [mRNA]  locus=scaffold2859:86975:93767:+ [translate_table: standard]
MEEKIKEEEEERREDHCHRWRDTRPVFMSKSAGPKRPGEVLQSADDGHGYERRNLGTCSMRRAPDTLCDIAPIG